MNNKSEYSDEYSIVHEWPEEDLEYLGYCPVCKSGERDCIYNNLKDRLFNSPGKWDLYLCKNCLNSYIDPRPTVETISLAYKNYITHFPDKEKSQNKFISIRNSYLNRIYGLKNSPSNWWGYYLALLVPSPIRFEWDYSVRHLNTPLPDRNKLLDVGCGNGAFMLKARKIGWDVKGLEFDINAAQIGKSQGLDIYVDEYLEAPFEPSSFDVITCSHVIEHIHNPASFVNWMRMILKPGGTLWLATPNLMGLSHQIFGRNWYQIHSPQHLFVFSRNGLTKLIEKSGFTISKKNRGFGESRIAALSAALESGAKSDNEVRDTYKKFSNIFEILRYESKTYFNNDINSEIVLICTKNI